MRTWTLFQSTPLCEGRPDATYTIAYKHEVSIHAPVRGATGKYLGKFNSVAVSIHAPVRGATDALAHAFAAANMFQSTPLCEGRPPVLISPLAKERFNPRPCARGDMLSSHSSSKLSKFQSTPLCEGRLYAHDVTEFLRLVSIHAPVRGATSVPSTSENTHAAFQSTPLCEGRPG